MTRSPDISAIIPAYNSADFIADAVASMRAQTHPVDEIIIVDDGSRDNTREVIRTLGDDIVLIQQANAGPSAARNAGIDRARGAFIAFLDADDQWTPEKTASQLEVFARHPDMALVAADMAEVDADGRTTVASMLDHHGLLEQFKALDGAPVPAAMAALTRKNFIPTGTVLVRREAVIEAGRFTTAIRWGEDLELWAKIAARHPLTCLPVVHMLRRRHEANATSNTTPMLEDLVRVMESLRRWGAAELKQQGVDADKLVASALADLGYWHFQHNRTVPARAAFGRSLRESPTLRSLVYRLASQLPGSWVAPLRRIKQQTTGSGTQA